MDAERAHGGLGLGTTASWPDRFPRCSQRSPTNLKEPHTSDLTREP